MPRKKMSERNVRKLMKTGNGSILVTLPIEYIRDLGWREKQNVVVKRVKGGLLIKDWRSR
ncbi:MAG: hypothetical protein COU09_03045 [Candidatus Harrisonbacteria bacterium CG10_big_fil_rev_8_21_14_0_10_44_23]|uniref:SpoVT-AbrB domain-containing protein n=1 Tax=Candidatus Harrisonbacteria bacterium CG10_big_fil_rev_8_21_14_0_10_44_23 TaxID=1974585 RepID=A0A2H0UPD3_9BACT|nr:MAG: hypothetical protein COU09_03045 [Candidatus Harrisonbacteria bacterium CG10_big_fil_rev_8_21_14_0_10_44_23]